MTRRRPLRRPFASRKSSSSHILVVCTAGICRSPFLASLLADRLPALTISSAGTFALARHPIDEPVAEELRRRRIVPVRSGVRFTARRARQARLILTATRLHTAEVVARTPELADRTFTAKELARILRDAPDLRRSTPVLTLAAITDHARSIVATDQWDHDDDIADPFARDDDAYRTMFEECDAVATMVSTALATPGDRL